MALKVAGFGVTWSALDVAALGAPLLQAAIQDPHVPMPERQEHPPHPGGCDPAAGIVDHDRIVVGDAERADVAAELFGVREHMRQRIGMIGDRVDVEPHRARDVRVEIVVLRQRQDARHLELRVDDLDAGIAEMGGEPFGGDKRIVGGGHMLSPCHSGARAARARNLLCGRVGGSMDSGFATSSRPGMTMEC